jgi:hypothetical protein
MSDEYMANFCGVGLKRVTRFPGGGSRIKYKGDDELLALVKSLKNVKILVTDDNVFILEK